MQQSVLNLSQSIEHKMNVWEENKKSMAESLSAQQELVRIRGHTIETLEGEIAALQQSLEDNIANSVGTEARLNNALADQKKATEQLRAEAT